MSGPTPLADLFSEFLLLGVQASQRGHELPEHGPLKQKILTQLEHACLEAQKRGIPSSSVEDAKYAIAAYLDEMFQFSSWPERDNWAQNPLQGILFGDYNAGIGFFERLARIRQSGAPALELYYLCLVLGFGGRYRLENPAALRQHVETIGRDLAGPRPESLAIPAPPMQAHTSREDPRLIWLTVGILALGWTFACVLWILLMQTRASALTALTRALAG